MQNKTVVIVGVLDEQQSTNVWQAAAFMRNGWNAIPINYRNFKDGFAEHYKFIVERFNPELVLLSKVNGVDPNIFSSVKTRNVWYWFMDNIKVAEAVNAIEYAKISSHASATSSEVVELFKTVNQSSYNIIEGFEPKIFYKEEAEKDIDILFFGNATAKRIELLSKIDKKVEVFGVGWPEEFEANNLVFLDDLRKVIARSKIVLNLVHSNIFSDRVVTAMACGSFVLSEYCRDLFTYFDNEEHLVWFTNTDECNKYINEYLVDDDKREQIAQNGMKKVNELYTWDMVIQRIIHLIGE